MASSSWPENSSDKSKRAIEELVRGREFADKLRNLFINRSFGFGDDGSVYAEDLVAKILKSFADTLLVLNRTDADEVSQIPVKKPVSSCCDTGKSEDSGESTKTSTIKDRRGSYKRRKTSETWNRVTPNLIDDGHAWRKYGQKVILNANYPRNYFRCTHKYDQGCQAIKHVQRINEEPAMYRTTYHGHHTCSSTSNLLKSHQIVMDSSPRESSAALLSFGTNFTSNQHHPFFSSASSMKREFKEEMIPNDLINIKQSSSAASDEYFVSPDITAFESSGHMTVFSSTMGSDHGDTASTEFNCLDMDVMVGFDDVLQQFEF